MLDIKLILKDPEYADYAIKRLETRGFNLDLYKIKKLENRKKELIALIEEENRKKNIISKATGILKYKKQGDNLSKDESKTLLLKLFYELEDGIISEDELCECLYKLEDGIIFDGFCESFNIEIETLLEIQKEILAVK